MLKGIDRRLSAEIVHALMSMGHGDDLLICDVNHPAAAIARDTVWGRVIDMPGCGIAEGAAAILTLMPLDTFVAAPVTRMEVVGDPAARVPVFDAMQAVIDRAEGRPRPMIGIERFAFYDMARKSYAVIQTGERRFYGCFMFRKGVIPPDA